MWIISTLIIKIQYFMFHHICSELKLFIVPSMIKKYNNSNWHHSHSRNLNIEGSTHISLKAMGNTYLEILNGMATFKPLHLPFNKIFLCYQFSYCQLFNCRTTERQTFFYNPFNPTFYALQLYWHFREDFWPLKNAPQTHSEFRDLYWYSTGCPKKNWDFVQFWVFGHGRGVFKGKK